MTDQQFMQRALELAVCGNMYVAPNPMVGCVIVNDGKIIGEGYHHCYGQAHAEVNAIAQVKDENLLKTSTLYVTLEPCSHFGKTPPCADLIIKKQIPKVVVAVLDSNPKVAGNGIKKLREAGIEVEVGLMEQEARHLNKRFFTYHQQHRPYIILKWAQTQDGYMDCNQRGATHRHEYWITNDELRYKVHQWRAEEQAIFCGANTLLNDNPQLNVRMVEGKNPIRMTYLNDSISDDKHFLDGSQPSWIFTSKNIPHHKNVEYFSVSEEHWVQDMLKVLYERKIQSIIIEGGQQTLNYFIRLGLWDEARVLVGNKIFGDGLQAPILKNEVQKTEIVADNKILYYQNGEI